MSEPTYSEIQTIFYRLTNIPRTASNSELWDAATDIAKDYVHREAPVSETFDKAWEERGLEHLTRYRPAWAYLPVIRSIWESGLKCGLLFAYMDQEKRP